ncbi:unnamed protein product [Effrenium voratum]|uniref:WW domain-containing protein n=1 Tax=Effrenium voratum TaxID=2562239 RepID=A0AA36JMB6_9DINO|nr:unnamed protein product [Effrenium voratum]
MAAEGERTAGEGKLVSKILVDALAGVPLPVPWEAAEEDGRSYFTNSGTGESTWDHPLSPQLAELSSLALRCLALKPRERWQAAKLLRQRFQAEAEKEYRRWYAAEDDSGNCYFCNRDTSETMWEHPAAVVLPQFYLRIRCAELLQNNEYLKGSESGLKAAEPSRLSRTLSSLRANIGLRRLNSLDLSEASCISAGSCSTVSFNTDLEGALFSDDEDEDRSESDGEAHHRFEVLVPLATLCNMRRRLGDPA